MNEGFDQIPHGFIEQFNKLFPMERHQFVQELADTNVMVKTEAQDSVTYYGERKVDGAPIILLSVADAQHFVFLPEGSS